MAQVAQWCYHPIIAFTLSMIPVGPPTRRRLYVHIQDYQRRRATLPPGINSLGMKQTQNLTCDGSFSKVILPPPPLLKIRLENVSLPFLSDRRALRSYHNRHQGTVVETFHLKDSLYYNPSHYRSGDMVYK